MAIQSICAKLINGYDGSCEAPVRRFWQQAVLINKADIDPASVTVSLPDPETGTCSYTVAFTLNTGTTGYRIVGPEAGSSIFGSYDKSRSDLGYAQYIHHAQLLISGVDEESKCILDSLDKGSFVVALQLKDGTVVMYGWGNGLSTGDYTYSIQEGGGGTPIMLSSLEVAPENNLPLVYVSGTPGSEGADFDSAFSNLL